MVKWKLNVAAASVVTLIIAAPVQAQLCQPEECEVPGEGSKILKYCDFDTANKQVYEDVWTNSKDYSGETNIKSCEKDWANDPPCNEVCDGTLPLLFFQGSAEDLRDLENKPAE